VISCTSASQSSTGAGDHDNVFVQLFGKSLYAWNYNATDPAAQPSTLLEYPTSLVFPEGSKDVIAVYFSASWCGPCKQFTPILAKFFSDMNKKLGSRNIKNPLERRFEVILISRDDSVESYVQYFAKMPWLAVPFDNVIDFLSNRCGTLL
jgi:thiol-disulfide isomerase/thioredoxin